MLIKACLKPGQNGTKKWSEQYGDSLVSVRYRYDKDTKRRYTTVEIIVEEGEWTPVSSRGQHSRSMTDRFGIRVEYFEKAIQEKVKQAGGIWRPRHQLWELPYGLILSLGLEDRIVGEE